MTKRPSRPSKPAVPHHLGSVGTKAYPAANALRTADIDHLRGVAMERARTDFERDGEITPDRAAIFGLDGSTVLTSMSLDDREQRRVIQELAVKHRAWLVHHLQESWVVTAPADDARKVLALEAAAQSMELHLHPERREILIFWEEHHVAPIRRWTADISRDAAGHPTLGSWKESDLRLPRPGFKRYLSLSLSDVPPARTNDCYAS